MFKFVAQTSSAFVLVASTRTHRLRLLSAPCLQGRRSEEVTRQLPSALAVCMQLRSAHGCCKRPSTVDDAALASVNRISTPFLSATNVTFTNKQLLGRNRFGTRLSRHQHNEFSTTSSSSTRAESGITEKELKREIDDLTDKFMETRELLEDAMESKDTVYFNDDLQDAKESVQETLSQFEGLMTKLSEDQERNVRRTIGLKMEELRAQEAMIDESLKED